MQINGAIRKDGPSLAHMCVICESDVMQKVEARSSAKRSLAWYHRNREKACGASVDRRRKFIIDVRKMFGGKCDCCAESELEFLTIDHRNGDGGGFGRTGHYYAYREIKRALESSNKRRIARIHARYRLFCWNCNVSTYKHGICAHKRGGVRLAAPSEWAQLIRDRVAFAKWQLGDECACCHEDIEEFLEIDHINEDGFKVKRAGNRARRHLLYYMEVERAFRKHDITAIKAIRAKYQVLCVNCNRSKHYGRGTCVHQRSSTPTLLHG